MGTAYRRSWHPPLPKRLDSLTPIHGHIRQDLVPDPRHGVEAGCGPHIPISRGHDFAKSLGDMELNLPDLLIRPCR